MALRCTYVMRDGKLVPKHQAAPLHRSQRSAFPTPSLRRDSIEPVQSMADGKTYDSLSALRRTYRAEGNPQGIEYQEIGDEKRPDPEMPKVTKDDCAVLLDKAEAAIARGEVPDVPSIHDPL